MRAQGEFDLERQLAQAARLDHRRGALEGVDDALRQRRLAIRHRLAQAGHRVAVVGAEAPEHPLVHGVVAHDPVEPSRQVDRLVAGLPRAAWVHQRVVKDQSRVTGVPLTVPEKLTS